MTSVALSSTVSDLSDESLLQRAVINARGRFYRKGAAHPRWVAVSDAFALGSTYSRQLCRRFDIDPDEMVKR